MNVYCITIDGGTTNSRAVLWSVPADSRGGTDVEGAEVLSSVKAEVGVADTAADGHNGRLRAAVKDLLETLLKDNSLTWDDIESVYASGMITSDVGLYELPHLIAPASLSDFAAGVHAELLADICPLPIRFIPGLRNMPAADVNMDNLERMDIMRGEETEALALLSQAEKGRSCLLVLPGSHTKFVSVDAQGRLTGCLTSVAGEMLSLLTRHSIVADAVKRSFVTEPDPEFLVRGFRASQRTSLARAGFLTRIVRLFVTDDPQKTASFLLGAVLENDIAAVRGSEALSVSPDTQVRIAGKESLAQALKTLLLEDGFFSDVEITALKDGRPMAGAGALLVASEQRRQEKL